MPAKLVQRNFIENRTYHITNYGLEKRPIFRKKEDYDLFISYIKTYIQPLELTLKTNPTLPKRLYSKNLYGQIDILSYCLLPDHFHFLIHQTTKDGISKFMKQLTNAYTYYFNQKYHRSGSLLQGRYKSIVIEDIAFCQKVSRFIHLHPYNSKLVIYLNRYPYSSYMEYINSSNNNLCKVDLILQFFQSRKLYQKYTLDLEDYKTEQEILKPYTLDK